MSGTVGGEGDWIALFSGGKDSQWALYQAIEQGLEIRMALTAEPEADSFLFHVPALDVTGLLGEALGIPVRKVRIDAPQTEDSSEAGDEELAALAAEIASIKEASDQEIRGIITGAVASRFQHDRLEELCDQLGLEQFSPLWGVDPESAFREMLAAGFEIHMVAVAAGGLGPEWLGKAVDRAAFEELRSVADTHGLHLLGEGGEFETLVVDGPHMQQRLCYDAETHWDGTRGHLEITDAWLEDTPSDR